MKPAILGGKGLQPWYEYRDRSVSKIYIKSVIIKDGVTNVGAYAFYNCVNMMNATAPDSVTSIGDSAFKNCSSLSSMMLPNSINSIGEAAFMNCSSLSSLQGAENVASIGDLAFYGCTSLPQESIPSVPGGDDSGGSGNSDGSGDSSGSDSDTTDDPMQMSNNVPVSSVSLNGHVYSLYDSNLTWGKAKQFCEEQGGHLVTITSSDEQNAVQGLLDKGHMHQYWIGMSRSNGNMVWVTGESVTYTKWDYGEPNHCNRKDGQYENYVHIYNVKNPVNSRSARYCWNDMFYDNTYPGEESNFSLKYVGFICEWESEKSITLEDASGRTWKDITVKGTIQSKTTPSSWDVVWSVKGKKYSDDYYIGETKITSLGGNKYKVTQTFQFNEEGSYEVSAALGDVTGTCTVKASEFFEIGKDTNHFVHCGIPYGFSDIKYAAKLQMSSNPEAQVANAWLVQTRKKNKEGVCHGVSVSMCLGDQKLIDFDSITDKATNYWELGELSTNPDFKDLVLYCHLMQNSDKPTDSIEKGGWHIKSKEDRLKTFLKSFVEEAKSGMEQEVPFVLKYVCYGVNDNHTVVVCGYRFLKDKNIHQVKIYDLNSYSKESSPGFYRTMEIDKECNDFVYNDVVSRSGINTEWDYLCFFGTSYIEERLKLPASVQSKSVQNINNDYKISVSANKKFKLSNREGKWLSFDGVSYDGTMNVYDCCMYGAEGSEMWNMTTDASDAFTLEQFENGCALLASFENQAYGVFPRSADSITVSDKLVIAKGKGIDCMVSVGTDKKTVTSLDVAGEGQIDFKYTEDATVTSTVPMKRATVTAFDGKNVKEKRIPNPEKKIVISQFEKSSLSGLREKNKIKASNIVKGYRTKKQSFKLNATAKGGARLTYKSNNKKVKVDKDGKVTIAAKFSGTAKINITAAETNDYKKTTKAVTVTVPTVTNVKKVTAGKAQMSVEWKKNTTGKGYEVQCSTDKKFKKAVRTVKIKKNASVKTNIKKLKKGRYYVRIRTVNGKKCSDWSKKKIVIIAK